MQMQVDRATDRAAAQISLALDKMVGSLPEGAAPQMAFEVVVRKLVMLQPWFMALIMEDTDIRETYAAEVARMPVNKPGKGAGLL